MRLVAGIDSSTQSCKVVIRDADTGALVRQGRATHPEGTEVNPAHWWTALAEATAQAGGFADVAAVSVAAQQHGMVVLDENGAVLRDALLWNDIRSAPQAVQLIEQFGGSAVWANEVGVVPVASFTITKLAWLAQHEPEIAAQVAAVCLPHDWLTWRLAGGGPGGTLGLDALVTDRGDASGTGYWSTITGAYRRDLFSAALGHDALLPRVLGPTESAGMLTGTSVVLGAGTGDNMAAALGLAAGPGDVIVSIGTSAVVSVVADVSAADPTGAVAGFADATGHFLPLVCTLNGARVIDATARMLGVVLAEVSELAMQAPPGSGGLVLVPFLEGERTPNRPEATGALHGLQLDTANPAFLARAALEGLLCGLADGLDALVEQGARVDRIMLVGGGAKSEALCRIAPSIFGRPVLVPPNGEYVADGAARQAAWALTGGKAPQWDLNTPRTFASPALPTIRARYAEVREMTARRPTK